MKGKGKIEPNVCDRLKQERVNGSHSLFETGSEVFISNSNFRFVWTAITEKIWNAHREDEDH